MTTNIKLKSILAIFFTIILVSSYSILKHNKKELVKDVIKEEKKDLTIHYEYILQDFQKVADTHAKILQNDSKIVRIMKKAEGSSLNQQAELRDELYKITVPIYNRLKIRGITNLQFVFPDSKTFLRVHRKDRFGDYLSDIRYSFAYTNKTHKPISGLEQGKSKHAYRYVYPLFDENRSYIGAFEFSFGSRYIQDTLTKSLGIHTHFLLDKELFDAKIWNRKDQAYNYVISIEHPKYMFATTSRDSEEKYKEQYKFIIDYLRDEITSNMNLKKDFSLNFVLNDMGYSVIFIPIKNIKEKKVIAYLVSYVKHKEIFEIYDNFKNYLIVISFLLLIIFYFIYKNFLQKQSLRNEVKKQTKMIQDLNANLEERIKEKIEEQALLISLFDKGDAVLFKWNNDETWSIDYVSLSVKKLLGYEKDDFISKKIVYASCIHEDDLQRVTDEVTEAIQSNVEFFKHAPYRVITKDGNIRWVLDYTIIARDEYGEITHFIGYISNITELKLKNQQLLQQSRLAQMGEMISMIAHQWRQPLGAISSTAVNLRMKLELESFDLETKKGVDEAREYFLKKLTNINDFVQDLSTTIDDFRNFYKPNKLSVTIKLQDVILKSLNVIKESLANDNIEIIEEYKDKKELKLYSSEMMQVILNILKNSQDNFKEKGTKNPKIVIKTQERKITICDNGGGIPEDIIEKVFDPYFSTKDEKNGTGLGLYMSKTIIQEHHKGKLYLQNSNDGVCFTIELEEKFE